MRKKILYLVFFALLTIPYENLSAEPIAGISSGLFIAPNPGTLYTLPVTAGLFLRMNLWEPFTLVLNILGNGYAFLPKSQEFGSSIMATIEGSAGFQYGPIGNYADGLVVGIMAGGGGYIRTIEVDSQTADGEVVSFRRPLFSAALYTGLTSQSWYYELGLRYRIIFETASVHTLEPSIGVAYRFRGRAAGK